MVPTSRTTFCVFAPGTVITMLLLPCCWTCAPLKPAPFTRAIMIARACVMSDADGALPVIVCASSVTEVPPARSSPS